MKAMLIGTFAILAGICSAPATAGAGMKCTAEYTDGNWPYYGSLKYTPENTFFRFVCPGFGTPQTISQLYQAGWKLVALPYSESNFGGGNRYSIWIEMP